MDDKGRPAVPARVTQNGKPGGAGLAKATLKRPPSGVTVSTVKRVAIPPRPSSHLSSLSGSSSPSFGSQTVRRPYNALPEETRRRIEEQRREKERAAREKEESERAQRRAAGRENGTPRKNKAVKKHVLSDDDGDDDELFSTGNSTPKKKRRDRKSATPAGSSGYKKAGRDGVTANYNVARDLLNPRSFRHTVGDTYGGDRAIQSADLLLGKKYGQFFHHLEADARVSLEYPADDCTEEFSLLAPKDKDEYDPIADLLRTVRCIVEFYVTEEQRESHFGSLDTLDIGSTAGNILSIGHGSATPADGSTPLATASNSREGTPVNHGVVMAARNSQTVPASPARSAQIAPPVSTGSPMPSDAAEVEVTDKDSILRSFTKARNRRDGQLFIRTVGRFNTALQMLKAQGSIRENVAAMCGKGVSEGIWRCIQEQCYARTVAPRVEELSKYEAFSDNVYGELLPIFMSEIAQLTSLGPGSVFVDLGSGVGNLLIQVALQTGSKAFGCEQMIAPSELAQLQIAEAGRRWRMWGLHGAEMQAWQADFMQDPRVGDVLRQADVILVNNYAFSATTNNTLSLLFLDLKEGAHIVSLKPFVPSDFRLTQRTASSPLAILRVTQRTFTTGCVSWMDGGGPYYIHTVDRTIVAKFLGENGQLASTADVKKKQWKAAQEDDEEEDEG